MQWFCWSLTRTGHAATGVQCLILHGIWEVAAPEFRGWHKLEGVQFKTRPPLTLRREEQSPAHRESMCAVTRDSDRGFVGKGILVQKTSLIVLGSP